MAQENLDEWVRHEPEAAEYDDWSGFESDHPVRAEELLDKWRKEWIDQEIHEMAIEAIERLEDGDKFVVV